ncbi:MAG: Asp-tRNA(Asn)/Glu-tRNA(Gln) amidotransferase subunit GatA [Dehalococcoidia bacterium]|nr:Asp-tRNA(Asn)/Glu-tRNA(Gln) amidotransferase subunit GatA [Dehalococcoidia bacterium]
MPELYSLTIGEAGALLKKRELSSVELTTALLQRIRAVEDKVKAYVTVTDELALRQAAAADKRIAAGDAGPLTGIPMQLKDNLNTRGVRTTCSSRMLEQFVSPYDACVTERLAAAGAVLLGKGNMDEFAMGSSTENSAFFPTRNPWDLQRVPGGSSGGPAAAVAAGECLFSLGSDTGGSIRQPASFCGVVGLKPTYGLVSRYGLVAFASSLDQVGPLTKTVADCAVVLQAIAGHDARDSTSVARPVPGYAASLGKPIAGMRIGIPREYFQGIDPHVGQVLERAIQKLAQLGAVIDRGVSLPSTHYALAVYYILAPSEASANLARYDGAKYGFAAPDAKDMWDAMEQTRRHGFGPEVKRRILLGTYALSAGYYDAYYLKALKVRALIRQEFELVFQRYDALLTPTSPTPPFRLGEKLADPVQMYLSDVDTIPVNIAGIAGISVPAGFLEGLPVGMQLIGPAFSEPALLQIAHAYEQATGWHKLRAPVQ